MADISSFLLAIKNAIYGEDVRNSIYNAINAINNENSSLASVVTNDVQKTLDNLRVYEQVNSLPASGDSKILYALTDIQYVDADSNNPAAGDAATWDTLTDTPYIQVPINEVVYDDVSAGAIKPVMARYYIVSNGATVELDDNGTILERSATIETINLKNNPATAFIQTYSSGRTTTKTFDTICLDNAKINISRQAGESLDRLVSNVRSGSISLQYMEWIYDAADQKWKLNNEGTYECINMSFEYKRVSTGNNHDSHEHTYDQTLRYNSGGLKDVLFCHNYKAFHAQFERQQQPPDIRSVQVYHNGVRFQVSTIATTLAKIAEVEYDSNGYLTDANSTGLVISIKDLFHWMSGEATYVTDLPKNWQVPYTLGSAASLWFWSDVIKSYVSVSGSVDPSSLRPTGYSKTLTNWNNNQTTVTITGLDTTKNYMIAVSPDVSSKTEYINKNVYCESVTTDGLIFKASSTPSTDLTVGIVIQEINGETIINNE